MKISQLVEELLRLQGEYDDVDVVAYSYGDITPSPVDVPTVHSFKSGPSFVLIEP